MVWTLRNSSATTVIVAAAVTLLLGVDTHVQADWIDPDTPESAHYARPLDVPPPNKPTSSSSEKKRRHHKHHVKDEDDDTEYPSIPPTEVPSTSPTEYPTFSPVVRPGDYKLVMSDEFNTDGRQFQDGADPKWTALDKNDYTNEALHYYSPDNVETKNGDMIIKTEAKTVNFVGFNDTAGKFQASSKNFKSAMLQTWNKFCFTGGIIEAEIELPGKSTIGGLWPAFWLLGNMARHTYVGSTNHIWPWSSNACGEKAKSAQRINGCMKANHYGLHSEVGRGAPEIDIFEVQPGEIKHNTGVFHESSVGQPFASTSFQVAPGRSENRPGGGYWPGPGQWYEGLRGGDNTNLNILFYGNYNHFRGDKDEKDYWSDAISFNYQLDESHFQKKHRYRVEWDVPDEDEGTDGYIRWFINNKFVLEINGTGIVKAGVNSTVSTEPMYIIMNTAVSTQWGFPTCPPDCPCKKFDCNSNRFAETCGFNRDFCQMMKNKEEAPSYKTNWVRVYQDPTNPKHKVGCSTPERPTKTYIEAHQDMYKTTADAQPLKPIQVGRGVCNPNAKDSTPVDMCGGPTKGNCTSGRVCECQDGWTGPHCLVPVGSDPVNYEKPDDFEDLDFTGPQLKIRGIWHSLGVILLTLLLTPTIKNRLDRWTTITEGQL